MASAGIVYTVRPALDVVPQRPYTAVVQRRRTPMNSTTQATDGTLVENLKYLVNKHEQALADAEAKLKQAEEWRDKCKRRLDIVRELVQWEREDWERRGKQLHLDDQSPYAGLRLRDAAVLVIKERAGRPITFREIVQVLAAHGYPGVERGHPGRALHAALIGVPDVEKVASGTYRWRGNKLGANDSSEAAGSGSSVT